MKLHSQAKMPPKQLLISFAWQRSTSILRTRTNAGLDVLAFLSKLRHFALVRGVRR